MKIENNISKDVNKSESKELGLKAYSQPEITKLGAMQRVTLGGSPGTEDSGGTEVNPQT